MTLLVGALIDVVLVGAGVFVYRSAGKVPFVRHNRRP